MKHKELSFQAFFTHTRLLYPTLSFSTLFWYFLPTPGICLPTPGIMYTLLAICARPGILCPFSTRPGILYPFQTFLTHPQHSVPTSGIFFSHSRHSVPTPGILYPLLALSTHSGFSLPPTLRLSIPPPPGCLSTPGICIFTPGICLPTPGIVFTIGIFYPPLVFSSFQTFSTHLWFSVPTPGFLCTRLAFCTHTRHLSTHSM